MNPYLPGNLSLERIQLQILPPPLATITGGESSSKFTPH